MKKNILISLLLVALTLIIVRISNLPANITPIIAIAVIIHKYIQRRILAILLMLAVMLASDLMLGFYPEAFITYLLIGIFVFIGSSIKNNYLSGLVSVLMWHITINGMVYFGDHGASTLIATYIQALVFDARLLLSTLSFIFLFHQLEKVFTYKQVEQQA